VVFPFLLNRNESVISVTLPPNIAAIAKIYGNVVQQKDSTHLVKKTMTDSRLD